ncbi:MAG: hypothetical protein ABI607_08660 [Betaproteobacteria bacterium]
MFRIIVSIILMPMATIGLAASPKAVTNTIATKFAFMGTDTMKCYPENERCIVPVYVRSDGTANGCVITNNWAFIKVPPPNLASGNRIKIVWLLQLSDSDEIKSEYTFRDTDGVTPNTGQDPNNEFRNKQLDKDHSGVGETSKDPTFKKRYRWTSFHPGSMGQDVAYNINVVRVVNGQTTRCDAKDPTITNQN